MFNETIDQMGNGDLAQCTFMGYYGAGQGRMLMCVGCADPRVNTRLPRSSVSFCRISRYEK